MKTDIHNKSFARRLVLKERLRGIEKWPVTKVAAKNMVGFYFHHWRSKLLLVDVPLSTNFFESYLYLNALVCCINKIYIVFRCYPTRQN